MNNTNLLYAYCEKSELGTVREIFFPNQVAAEYPLRISREGDFVVSKKYTVEVGGKGKGFRQIKNMPESYVVADDVTIGSNRKIPLWLFGFLY